MFNFSDAIEEYFRCHLGPFSVDEFRTYLKKQKIRLSADEVLDLLINADYIFSLLNNMFITRAGVFTNQLFSFSPTKEEFDAGAFVPGHRFMPFVDPSVYPYYTTLVLDDAIIPQTKMTISMNTALDVHAFFGEGYVIPYILGDPANEEVSLTSVPYGLPSEVNMTAYSLQPFIDQGFEFGDRILCKVIDWDKSIISCEIVKGNHGSLKFSQDDMDREDWYSHFEEAFLEKIDKFGPTRSIEEQLAFLFLEEQHSLCVRNCGSCGDFLEHTSQLDFSNYGVESRLWKAGETIPFVGNWNRELLKNHNANDVGIYFTEHVIDSFIKDSLAKSNLECNAEETMNLIFPTSINLNDFERKLVLLNLEKRIDIVKSKFNRFNDFPLTQVRSKVLKLFSKVSELVCGIICSTIDLEKMPQAELVILTQIMNHVVRLLEEIESDPVGAANQKDEISLSLGGMSETFDEIEGLLRQELKKLQRKTLQQH